MEMFCCQCEETVNEIACTKVGVCGKSSEVAGLIDCLVELSLIYAARASDAKMSAEDHEIARQLLEEAFFKTITNVNFDPESLSHTIRELILETEILGAKVEIESYSIPGFIEFGQRASVTERRDTWGEEAASLAEILIQGLKGTAAYAHHAAMLGKPSSDFIDFLFESAVVLQSGKPSQERLLELCLKCGAVNLVVMELLDNAHRDRFGIPEPNVVNRGVEVGKAILVSGHDLEELYHLLVQTEGTGINIYTHSEMLPAHGYPGLREFAHLRGNFGGAWHQQWQDFEAFPGPIVMTSNCIQRPKASYEDRIFTTGPVGWPGVKHIANRDFSVVIEKARECEGFQLSDCASVAAQYQQSSLTTGFGHEAILSVADKVIAGVKSGDIKQFFLVGGCDGRKSERSYYSEFTHSLPDNCLILTLGCAKYRFADHDFGDIGGIPRYLDIGQCNDAIGAIKIASALAEAFGTSVNELPLTLNISWYEQKAVCILLSLLHLGIRDIHLGPTLPAFISPSVLNVLNDSFGVSGISTARNDLEKMLV